MHIADDEVVVAELGGPYGTKFRVTKHNYEGAPMICLRQWYCNSYGKKEWKPGRQGLTATVDHWRSIFPAIAEALGEVKPEEPLNLP